MGVIASCFAGIGYFLPIGCTRQNLVDSGSRLHVHLVSPRHLFITACKYLSAGPGPWRKRALTLTLQGLLRRPQRASRIGAQTGRRAVPAAEASASRKLQPDEPVPSIGNHVCYTAGSECHNRVIHKHSASTIACLGQLSCMARRGCLLNGRHLIDPRQLPLGFHVSPAFT
jgi:hypothetical protein